MKFIWKALFMVTVLCLPFTKALPQIVYQHVDNNSIYEFLDEMANMKVIELNSAIKPYSRTFIAEKLVEISSRSAALNKRQSREFLFFMKEYNKEIDNSDQNQIVTNKLFGKNRVKLSDRDKRLDLYYFRDSTFMFSFNPILGVKVWNNDSGSVYHRWNGAEMMFYAGSHLGVYASLRDNYLSNSITAPDYITQETGGGFKNPTYGFSDADAVEYSEMRGGITANGKWWSLGIVKDHNVWGNNYNGSNIFTNRSPSFAQIKLNIHPVSWFELNYFHGWLSSKVVDTAATQQYGTGTTTVYVPKYIAANMITVKPVKNLYISLGNSIIYSQTLNAGYFIPVMFFKSLDHTYSTLGNSQMFFDISSRNLKKCHFYFTGYFDDFSFGRLFEKENITPWSMKVGGRVSNIIRNVSVTAEYTRNNIYTYKHYNPETTFESTRYNFGNYLRDNAQEIYFQLTYKPVARLWLDASYNQASKGPDYPDNRNDFDPVTGEPVVTNYEFQESIIWKKTAFAFQVRYEIINDLNLMLRFEMADVEDITNSYTPQGFQGNQLTTSGMITFGF
ncbi:MAG TPA: hypothetical protein PKD91_09145 [Bacteroidia bacterium]|nr:hypothetical protein [Bacteroidia bacterium]